MFSEPGCFLDILAEKTHFEPIIPAKTRINEPGENRGFPPAQAGASLE